MSEEPIIATAEAMRQAFDGLFARPAMPPAGGGEDILVVRIAGVDYALALAGLTGLHVDVAVEPLPGPVPEFLGLAGIRGALVPVYDLAQLLGRRPEPHPRWLALAPGPVGLAFEALVAHERVLACATVPGDEPGARHVRGEVFPLIHLAVILAAIARRANPQGAVTP